MSWGSEKSVLGGARIWLLVVALFVGSLAAAAPALGASANIRKAPGESAAFTLAGTNGYSLHFKSEKGVLTIIAAQGRPAQSTITPDGRVVPAKLLDTSSESTYTLAGVSRDLTTIDADLGRVGRVSLVFQPSGEKKVNGFDLSSKSEHCVGATKVVRRLGTFVGSVSFQGENGYTSAEATSVPGSIGTSPFRNCSTIRKPTHHGSKDTVSTPTVEAFLAAFGHGAFIASRASDEARFAAIGFANLGPALSVFREASASGPPDLFGYKCNAMRASVRPLAPFAGTAVFQDSRHGPPTWSGDLSVSFPGAVTPLTGDLVERSFLKAYGGCA